MHRLWVGMPYKGSPGQFTVGYVSSDLLYWSTLWLESSLNHEVSRHSTIVGDRVGKSFSSNV